MFYKATNGKEVIQFYAEDEKSAKKYLKDNNKEFSLLNSTVNFTKLYSDLVDTYSLISNEKSKIDEEYKLTILEQEARDYISTKDTSMCPAVIKQFGKKDIDKTCKDILKKSSDRRENLLSKLEEVETLLSDLVLARKALVCKPEECQLILEKARSRNGH